MLKEGSGLWIIDVRDESDYAAYHIESSVNIPAPGLARKKFPRNKPLVLVDDALGQRGAKEAAESLAKNGHAQVFLLEGGFFQWTSDGFPLVGKRPAVRGITPDALRWAFTNKVALRVFDMRDAFERTKGMVENSREVKGKSLTERMNNLAIMLAEEDKAVGKRVIEPRQAVVLVFSATENAAAMARELTGKTGNAVRDIRYLIGGYEAFATKNIRQVRTIGACPTCPK
jgi:rhodanese-related sulfurtransferase